jgi:hypothetical protein
MTKIPRDPRPTDKFKVGDRVRYWTPTEDRVGRVIAVYSGRASKTIGGFPYDELYDVQWDEPSFIGYAYLPHGLHGEQL